MTDKPLRLKNKIVSIFKQFSDKEENNFSKIDDEIVKAVSGFRSSVRIWQSHVFFFLAITGFVIQRVAFAL